MSNILGMWPGFDAFSTQSNALGISDAQLMCRLCMVNCGATMEPIFRDSVASCIADKIASVTRLTLRESDGLPALICQQCIFQLDVADTFIQRCILSDKSLRSLLPQVTGRTVTKLLTQPYTRESTPVPFVDHGLQLQPSREVLTDDQECANAFTKDPDTLPGNVVQTNLDFANFAPAFEAVDVALPEHVNLENCFDNDGAEYNSDVSSMITDNVSQGRHLLSADPLFGIKCEALNETESCEETEEGTFPVKIEVLENERIEHSPDGACNEDSEVQNNNSMKTEDLASLSVGCDTHGDDNIVTSQNAPNFIISSTVEISEHEPAQPLNQNQFRPAGKNHSCPICLVVLANRWSLIRHIKIHEKNEKREQRRLAYGTKNKSLPITRSKIIRPVHAMSESESLDTTRSSNIIPSSRTGDFGSSNSKAPADEALEISSHSKVPDEATRQHKCMVCSSTFVRHWNLLRHRKLHNKKITRVCLKKNTIADQEPNKLNMIPIVKVFPLVATKNGIQVANSLQQLSRKQLPVLSSKKSSAGQMEPCESMLIQGNTSTIVQKSADSDRNGSFDESSRKAAEESLQECPVCNVLCRNNNHLKSHMRSHAGDKGYQEFNSLKKPMRDHTESRKFKCRKCHSMFYTTYQLRLHEATHAYHKCLDCGKTFSRKCYLKVHSIVHSDARPWKCSQCDSVFKRLDDLVKHQRRHSHKGITNTVGSRTNTIQNITTHKLKTKETLVCKNTTSKPSKVQGLTKTSKHLSTKNLLLQNSRRTQTQKKKLVCGNAGSSLHKCETCGKVFQGKKSLKSHSAVHSTEKPWKCEPCGFSYKFRCSLKKHYQCYHLQQEISSFVSSTAPKFAGPAKEHKTNTSIHHKKLPMKQKATNVTQALGENIKKNPSSSKPRVLRKFPCTICEKRFKTATSLKYHVLIHSDERPWACGQCNFAFRRKDSLVRHIKLCKHVTSIIDISTRNKNFCSMVAPTSRNMEQNNFRQTLLTENPEQLTSTIHETVIPNLVIRTEVVAKSRTSRPPKISKETGESSQKKPSTSMTFLENLDGNGNIALEPSVTEPSQASESEILPKNDCFKHVEMLTKIHDSSRVELSSLQEADEPVHAENSIPLEAEILTKDYHVEHATIHKETEKSGFTECFTLEKASAHTEETSSEPLRLINAEVSPEVKLKIMSETNLKEEILHEDIHRSSPHELFPHRDSSGNREVIGIRTRDQMFAESLVFATMPEILPGNHQKNDDAIESSLRELYPQQRATFEISRKNLTDNHLPLITEISNEITSYGDKQHLRPVLALHLGGTETVNKIGTYANELHRPSKPHLTISNQVQSSRNISRIALVGKNVLRPFNCTHCDKTYRYLHELTKHSSGHLRKQSFHCSQCSASFYRKRRLRNHLISHSSVSGQKSETCGIESENNSDLDVHTLAHSAQTVSSTMDETQNFDCKESEEIAIVPTPFSEGNTSQTITEDIETFDSENPSKLDSTILFKALSCSTEFKNIGNGTSPEIPNINWNENVVPISNKQISVSYLKPRINDQPIQVTANKNENDVDASLESQKIDMFTTAAEEMHKNSPALLHVQHSSINRNCLIGEIYPQKQGSNIKCPSPGEERKAEIPMGLAQSEGEKSLSTEQKPTSFLYVTELTSKLNFQQRTTCLLKENTNRHTHHQPKFAQEGNVYSTSNVCQNAGFSDNVIEKNLEQNSKSFLKLLDSQKDDVAAPSNVDKPPIIDISRNTAQQNLVAVPLNIDKLSITNSSTNSASFIITTSGIAPEKEPYFGFSFLGTNFYNSQRQVVCKSTTVTKQDFECKTCGKRFSTKGRFTRHLKNHIQEQKSFVCEGCNRSFNVSGSLGCNCLASYN